MAAARSRAARVIAMSSPAGLARGRLVAEVLEPHRARELAGAPAAPCAARRGAAEQAGDRAAGEQQGAADEHEDGEDLGAEALEERRRGPVEALPDGAAVRREEGRLEVVVANGVVRAEPERPRGEGEQQREEQQDPAGVDGGRGSHDGRMISAAPQPASAIGTT